MESKGSLLLGVSWFLVAFSGAFLVTRLYCKHFLSRRGLWWDDHLLLVSWMLLLANVISITVSVHHGFGDKIDATDPRSLRMLTICTLLSTSTSILSTSISKTSFIMTLMRITVCCARHFLRFAIVTMNILFTLGAVFVWVECRPLASKWDSTINATCWPKSAMTCYLVTVFAYSAFLDLILSLLPWKLTSKLGVTPKERVGTAICMSFGFFAFAAAVVKSYQAPRAEDEYSFDGADLAIWGVVESSLIIIGASFPMFRFFYDDLRKQPQRNYGVQVTCNARGNCKMTKTVTVKGGEGGEGLASPVDSVYPKCPLRDEVDTGSDKSILGRSGSPVPDSKGIMQVQEIKVEYTQRARSDSEDRYGMEDV